MDEDERTLSDKLSGRIRRPYDAGGKRILEGIPLFSSKESGQIVAIEIPESPEGLVFVTAQDIPGHAKNTIGGVALPLFAKKDIRWKGQPILIATSPDIETTTDWLSRIRIEINENVSEKSHEKNSAQEYQWTKGNPSESFASAFQVVEDTFQIPSGPLRKSENTVTCLKDGASYTIHAATPWPGAVRRHVARTLGIDRSNVNVRPYSVGPGSGAVDGMFATLGDSCRASLLSWKAKKSVRIVTPPNVPASAGIPPGADFHIKGAVDTEGRILALETEFTLHAGAYLPLAEEVMNRIALGLLGITPIRNYSIKGTILNAKTPPSELGPAAGFELGYLAGELFASRVAENCLLSPGLWRRSFLPKMGQTFGPGIPIPKDYILPQLLERALSASDFERKNAACEQTMLGRKSLKEIPSSFHGTGMSCAWFGNGFLSSPRELESAALSLTLGMEGDLEINMPPYVTGGVLSRAWTNIAAGILGIEESAVKYSATLPLENTDPGPSLMGRNISIYSKLLELACNDLAKKRFRDALPISVSRSRRRTTKRPKESTPFEGAVFETISWGVCIVESSISTETLDAMPLHIWLFLDGGQLLMPEHARSAVEAETEKVIRWCLNDTHRLELPLIDVAFYDSRSKRTPRDISTLPWLLVPAALIRSIRQASGTDLDCIPVTPKLIRGRGIGL